MADDKLRRRARGAGGTTREWVVAGCAGRVRWPRVGRRRPGPQSSSAVLGRGDRKPTGRYIRDLARRRLPFALCTRTVLTMVHVRDVVEAIVGALERPEAVGKRYIVGVHQVSIDELNRMVSEIAGVPVPDWRLPDVLVLPVAALLTGLARLSGRPPAWGLSLDLARVLRRGFRYDGRAAARELGFSYTPIRDAVAEMLGVGAVRGPGSGVRDPGLATVMPGT